MRSLIVVLSGMLLQWSSPSIAQATSPASNAAGDRIGTTFVYIILVILIVLIAIALSHIRKSIASSASFSLSQALSEDVQLPAKNANGEQLLGADGKVVLVPTMVSSSSRVIAFMGSVMLLFLFMGFGLFAMLRFAVGAELKYLSEIGTFLITGLTLFAPYIVNKFSGVFTLPGK